MLVDPDFLLRIERDPAGAAPGAPYRLSDIEVAARLALSFSGAASRTSRCSTRPSRARSTEPAVLEAQVRRMLADPRARSLVDDFAMPSGCTCATWRT